MHMNLKRETYNWYVMILLGMLLFIGGTKSAVADSSADNLETKIIIQNVTEDEIITKAGTYTMTPTARIYNQSGKRVALQYIGTPCVARVTYEPQPGKGLPQISELSVIEVLPDRELHRHRISRFPE